MQMQRFDTEEHDDDEEFTVDLSTNEAEFDGEDEDGDDDDDQGILYPKPKGRKKRRVIVSALASGLVICLLVIVVLLVGFVFDDPPKNKNDDKTSDGTTGDVRGDDPSCGFEAPNFDDLPKDLKKRTDEIMTRFPLVDGHNDLPWEYRLRVGDDVTQLNISDSQPDLMTDIPRIRQGHLQGQFWSVYVPCGAVDVSHLQATIEQIDVVRQMVRYFPDDLALATTSCDVQRAIHNGKVASLIGMEGGHSINGSLAALRMFYEMGARYMTLTHTCTLDWADSAGDGGGNGGLTKFGREVVREMNRIGMIVDISHVSDDTMRDALDETTAPVMFSHSSARALCNHTRNVPDDVLVLLKKNDGVCMVNFYPEFVCQRLLDYRVELKNDHPTESAWWIDDKVDEWQRKDDNACNMKDVADHIDYIKKVASVENIGIGSDFDGIQTVPRNLEDVSMYPNLIEELYKRDYSDDDVQKIMGGNILRVLRRVEDVAQVKR
eukprot:TRINITY_DN4410_c0_g1_i1.p1 TRINITY_DN4410_c0_g1~~TRINITY_DN4410_c0_g1_i1.p1  ORF type:complete len:491 (+),score=100.13 TRINITY_DN4410_c0_g1_i1:158-1630(+)